MTALVVAFALLTDSNTTDITGFVCSCVVFVSGASPQLPAVTLPPCVAAELVQSGRHPAALRDLIMLPNHICLKFILRRSHTVQTGGAMKKTSREI